MSNRNFVRPADRISALKLRQTLKMATSAHAYVRGSTVQFYEWLGRQRAGTLPEGPAVWICGDCHSGNLGPVASKDGRVAIQIRDLDQTVIGNPVHDLVRLALSLASASRGSNLPGVTIAHILEQVVEGYRAALRQDYDQIDDAPHNIKLTMRKSVKRSWCALAKERLNDTKPTIPLGAKFWPLSSSEKRSLRTMFAEPDLRRLATSLRSRDDDAPIKVMDAAYWMKGCSSLGLLRFAVLLAIGKGKHQELALMDVKEAAKAAAAPRYAHMSMPDRAGERVVAGARALSPNLGERMVSSQIDGRSVFVRELLPQDLKLELERLSVDDAKLAANFLAGVVGKAHARQMTQSDRKQWANELERFRTKQLDAPSWLWTSVVALIGSHETAYLHHCREYAAIQAG